MPVLKPIQITTSPSREVPPDPDRTCDYCGKVVPGASAINVMIQIGVAGDPRIPPFQCPQEEHWACSPLCWSNVAKACIDEHMTVLLNYIHKQLGVTN